MIRSQGTGEDLNSGYFANASIGTGLQNRTALLPRLQRSRMRAHRSYEKPGFRKPYPGLMSGC